MLDLLDPVEDGFGKPEFSDTLGRLRWSTEKGAWTAGWLLLDDRLELGAADDEEQATARYRDEYVWLARDHRFSDSLRTRASVGRHFGGARPRRHAAATRASPRARSTRRAASTASNSRTTGRSSAAIALPTPSAARVAATRADYRYPRHSEFSPEVAAAFGRGLTEDAATAVQSGGRHALAVCGEPAQVVSVSRPSSDCVSTRSTTRRRRQSHAGEPAPQSALRLRTINGACTARSGRFTQAQHVEEWRVEEAQQAPDSAQVSIHSILGLEYDTRERPARSASRPTPSAGRPVAPYFDNQLDPFALLPDLTPDRVRVDPSASEASGLEFSVRKPDLRITHRLGHAGVVARRGRFSRGGDVLRSWDQPLSVNAGLAWKSSRASLSALGGLASRVGRARRSISIRCSCGPRNSGRWSDYYSLDLRGSWTWAFASGDLSVVLDLTNATEPPQRVLRGAGDGRAARRWRRKWITGCRPSSISASPTAGELPLIATGSRPP